MARKKTKGPSPNLPLIEQAAAHRAAKGTPMDRDRRLHERITALQDKYDKALKTHKTIAKRIENKHGVFSPEASAHRQKHLRLFAKSAHYDGGDSWRDLHQRITRAREAVEAKTGDETIADRVKRQLADHQAWLAERAKQAAPSRPSLIEQAAAARAKKGTPEQRRAALLERAKAALHNLPGPDLELARRLKTGTKKDQAEAKRIEAQWPEYDRRSAILRSRLKPLGHKTLAEQAKQAAPKPPAKAAGRGTPERLKKAQALRVERNRKKRGAKLHPGWGGGNSGHWVTIEEKGGGYHHVFIRD